jgi:hypothetical protein
LPIGWTDNVIPIENGARPMSGDLHGNSFRHA